MQSHLLKMFHNLNKFAFFLGSRACVCMSASMLRLLKLIVLYFIVTVLAPDPSVTSLLFETPSMGDIIYFVVTHLLSNAGTKTKPVFREMTSVTERTPLVNIPSINGEDSSSIDLHPTPPKHDKVKNALGTLNGCYVPCCLNIMGAVCVENETMPGDKIILCLRLCLCALDGPRARLACCKQ